MAKRRDGEHAGEDMSGAETAMRQTPAFTPRVRQFEAAGFRAWPAASVAYDGAWMVRLTAGHPAKRLNSVNSLDPGDGKDVELRLARASQKFRAYGRPLTVRVTPLTPPELMDYCDHHGWARMGASLILEAPLSALPIAEAFDQIPLKDIGRFVDAAIESGSLLGANRAGLSEVIGAIEPRKGLFVREIAGQAVSSLVCVQEGALAGLFEVATNPAHRRRGHARAVMLSALKWAHAKGARSAWLQVEEGNQAALSLYTQLGFRPVYSYHYRRLFAGGDT
jgi:ribosomal protein S18 acetylase RimI-like enzyme